MWSSRLGYAIHELPYGYLGENPYQDLEKIKFLRKISSICYDKNKDDWFMYYEEEIKKYIESKNEDIVMKTENWLEGGPYYELSILIANRYSKKELVNNCLQKIKLLSTNIKLVEDTAIVKQKIDLFIKKQYCIDLNILIEIAGIRKARLNIFQTLNELAIMDIWFHGSRFEENPINKENKHIFRSFLDELFVKFDSKLASINYEYDVRYLLADDAFNPRKEYSLDRIKLDEVIINLNKKQFEYAIIGKEITKDDIKKIFISEEDTGW